MQNQYLNLFEVLSNYVDFFYQYLECALELGSLILYLEELNSRLLYSFVMKQIISLFHFLEAPKTSYYFINSFSHSTQPEEYFQLIVIHLEELFNILSQNALIVGLSSSWYQIIFPSFLSLLRISSISTRNKFWRAFRPQTQSRTTLIRWSILG